MHIVQYKLYVISLHKITRMFLLRRKMAQGWVHKPRHNRHFECHQRCNFQSDELISGVYCHFSPVFLTYRNLKQSNAKTYISWSLLVVMCRWRGTNCTKRHWEFQKITQRNTWLAKPFKAPASFIPRSQRCTMKGALQSIYASHNILILNSLNVERICSFADMGRIAWLSSLGQCERLVF